MVGGLLPTGLWIHAWVNNVALLWPNMLQGLTQRCYGGHALPAIKLKALHMPSMFPNPLTELPGPTVPSSISEHAPLSLEDELMTVLYHLLGQAPH